MWIFGIKMVNNLLPVLDNIKKRITVSQDGIYEDFNCAGCGDMSETTAHLTICPAYSKDWRMI